MADGLLLNLLPLAFESLFPSRLLLLRIMSCVPCSSVSCLSSCYHCFCLDPLAVSSSLGLVAAVAAAAAAARHCVHAEIDCHHIIGSMSQRGYRAAEHRQASGRPLLSCSTSVAGGTPVTPQPSTPPDRPKGDVSVCARLRPGPRHEMCVFAEPRLRGSQGRGVVEDTRRLLSLCQVCRASVPPIVAAFDFALHCLQLFIVCEPLALEESDAVGGAKCSGHSVALGDAEPRVGCRGRSVMPVRGTTHQLLRVRDGLHDRVAPTRGSHIRECARDGQPRSRPLVFLGVVHVPSTP